MRSILLVIVVLLSIYSCRTSRISLDSDQVITDVEHRGVWIASVKNIDWPIDEEQSIIQLKESYSRIIDFYADMGFNAVYVQIRTAGDALYPTDLAPWSRFITGREGEPLAEDILPWMIKKTHERGLEFHAWLNPYRATTDRDTSVLSPDHLFHKRSDWIVSYGPKYYFNPAIPEVKEYLLDVIREVVDRYDIDGIHFDDYFYPYKVTGEVFDDNLQYANRLNKDLSLADWRRSNINGLIKECHEQIHDLKPHVQFGISPFGVWRNRRDDPTGSDTRAGQTTYDDLYADTRTWIDSAWMDYIAPQAYWSMNFAPAGHRVLVDWWSEEAGDMPLYMGLATYRVENAKDSAWHDLEEIPRQIRYARASDQVDGFICFSAKSLMQKPNLAKVLKNGVLANRAVTSHQAKWMKYEPECKIIMDELGDQGIITVEVNNSQADKIEVTYFRAGSLFRRGRWLTHVQAIKSDPVIVKLHSKARNVSVRLFNSMGHLSRSQHLFDKT